MRNVLSALVLAFSLADLVLAQKRIPHLPNPRLTPGAARDVTKDDLCQSRYESFDASVPVTVKGQVFDRYAIRTDAPEAYNVDHLIPVSLGGSNVVTNLWPQPLAGEWNYDKKNKLESRLYKLVCRGELELKQAQKEIATDWVSAYRKYLSEPGVDN
jgi:hypothetical protein